MNDEEKKKLLEHRPEPKQIRTPEDGRKLRTPEDSSRNIIHVLADLESSDN
jgi:hypothetical protein